VAILDRDRFDAAYGLYRGPAVMQDGISGYPDSVVDPGVDSSFVLDHPVSRTMFALSTNLVYAAAFDALAAMATELGRDGACDAERGVQVRAAVQRWFRDGDGYGYLVLPGPDGATLDPSAEALGLAFAVLGGLVQGIRPAGSWPVCTVSRAAWCQCGRTCRTSGRIGPGATTRSAGR
jgi:hypothetical protein